MKIINDVSEMREIQLNMMDCIHKFCIENDIKYSLAFGSMLGAVRHNGFIPWDDDIDIMMLRKDYDRFINSFNEYNSNYRVYDYRMDKEYNYAFAKICDERTLRIEYSKVQGLGIFIDLFPIDYYAESRKEALKTIKKAFFWKKILVAKNFKYTSSLSFFKNISIKFSQFMCSLIPIKTVLSQFDKLNKSQSIKRTAYCGYLVDVNSTSILKSEIFDSYCEYNFEGHKYYGIKDYDYYLRVQYGDYMTPPSEQNRISPHDIKGMYWK